MEQKEYRSPHGWFIIVLIIFTLCVFLWTMVYTMGQENVVILRKYKQESPDDMCGCGDNTATASGAAANRLSINTTSSSQIPTTAIKIMRHGKPLHRHDKTDLMNEALKRHVHSLPDTIDVESKDADVGTTAYSTKTVSLDLHGYEINKLSVGKNFYIYDCSITTTPDHLVVKILLELPEIKVEFKDHPIYSEYCPTINPYIHVVELVYLWGYDKSTMETDMYMKLSNLKITMVSWDDNLYRKSYEQVKNSPLYKVNIPMPLNLKKEELHDFLIRSNIFNTIGTTFSPPILLQPIVSSNTPI